MQENDDYLTLRSLLTTKEAGIVIGKGGKTIAQLRTFGVKASVSSIVEGVDDRLLTIRSTLQNVVNAYAFVMHSITESVQNPIFSLRILVSSHSMGALIGKAGYRIHHIQETTGVHMRASKKVLPQSTERMVELRGTPNTIQKALVEIGLTLLIDKDNTASTVLYNPSNTISSVDSDDEHDDTQIKHILIPGDMVGRIIGKGGNRISDIRHLSGCYIDIAKQPYSESGERVITLQGTPKASAKAIDLLYNFLNNDKEYQLKYLLNIQPEHDLIDLL